ncbi:putative phosphonates-binding periplasmic protein [Dinoroseobacter shibae DFL 12 = DSM 16493]|jgi:phosphonate transport system substrate-binding protein|uniref:Putative phosphonates-binding periplasmic protein n=1 Tax=Dinoroseobacter shibae (strain DSM 16493 / NCIMB 14021 / DFL 12) TaxID=398580 RepID=A8LP66_DINSH|nr:MULTISPECIES: phosphate/phosphite/phosphonate ABC transporter substrate-binding protein [Dinoroseobacter]ABV93748.1 putative phosphonates-binding periplasmic protein [Dinoroseobacter shibae DFL 12 = DSM 16493]MDD9715152.1 phosphate/phosphite/phosphonate ABC transporter substrate-binding protein [Dinoroseobacter sp. PD6]URF45202.1 phosphate/phosphite/phosphonate ABC transporter substrate-binding protein [Dinoroseobacter shibae]URF49507.1 phosphate/phosphite/phosphonate ABC transporter substra
MNITTKLLTGVSMAAMLTLGGAASAQDCPRGDLDERFCDVDGDLVADIPTDPSELVDPDTLIFAYTPVEDPAVYAEAWSDFIDHLSEVTGKDVVFFPVQSNAAQIEAMRSGRLHVAGFNTGSNPLAVNCAGFRPFALMAATDGSFGYEMEIITYPGSGIETIEDIKGGQLAFTSPTSNSGFKAPSAILKAEYGMEAEKDFEPVFSGKHDNSILGVANKDYPAAAIANSVLHRMTEREVVSEDQIVSIYTSQTFPTTGYGTAHNLTPELQDQIRDAFINFEWEGTSLEEEFSKSNEGQFLPMNYKEFWAVIRQIDEANGVSYACE